MIINQKKKIYNVIPNRYFSSTSSLYRRPYNRYNQLVYSRVPTYKEKSRHPKVLDYRGLLPPLSSIFDQYEIKTKFFYDPDKPANEGHQHYNMKIAVKNHLNNQSSFDIVKTCSTVQNNTMISPPYWTCNNKISVKNWLKGWDHCETEYRYKGAGIFDVALLKTTKGGDEIVGIVEIFSNSAMTKSKVDYLKKIKLPWIEICTEHKNIDDIIFKNEFNVFASSDGPWICDHCLKSNDLTLKSIASVIDIFPRKQLGWYGQRFCRLIYGIYESVDLQTQQKTLFLVESSYDIDCETLMYSMYKRQSTLIHSITDHTHESMMNELKTYFDHNFLKFINYDPHMIVDIKLSWPGVPLNELFGTNDQNSNIVNFENMKSLQSLFPSMTRLFGYNYKWDNNNRRWAKTRNYSSNR